MKFRANLTAETMNNFDLHNDSVPQLIQGMMFATVIGLEALGRSGSNAEIDDKVAELEGLTEDDQQILMPNGRNTRFNYFMAWARTHLKKAGIIESQGRALWAIKNDAVLPESREKCVEIYQITEANRRAQYKKSNVNEEVTEDESDDFQEAMDWHGQLLEVLKAMSPDAFERLAQRILRESGFS